MTKHVQGQKNIEYSGELMNYFINKKVKMIPNASYVIFVHNNNELNKMNEKLVKGLVEDGKKVIKATKTGNKKQPWILVSV